MNPIILFDNCYYNNDGTVKEWVLKTKIKSTEYYKKYSNKLMKDFLFTHGEVDGITLLKSNIPFNKNHVFRPKNTHFHRYNIVGFDNNVKLVRKVEKDLIIRNRYKEVFTIIHINDREKLRKIAENLNPLFINFR